MSGRLSRNEHFEHSLIVAYSDAVLINATLNCLGVLLKTRPAIANKIVSAVLNFNPLKQANSSMSPRAKVQIKSMERTTRALLLNLYRRYVLQTRRQL